MSRSDELFDRARRILPGGVNSPVRAFGGVGGTPRFAARGSGAYLETVDGDRLVDYVMSWGALLFGHARPEIVEAAAKAAERGTSFGIPTEAEVELAEAVVRLVSSVEKVRLVSSGTEATMSAVRLARGATGRTKVIKFAGHYHGHSDGLLADAGSGVATFGIPGSAGVTTGATQDTIVASWNDPGDLAAAVAAAEQDLAAILVEPVAANMGVVPPADGFLAELRGICDQAGALLVFDEVITGFRLGRGGAQERFGVTPDLTTLGKVLGGGFPLAAFGGRSELMDHLAPEGEVYQAGTLSGNPVAVAAGLAALGLVEREPPFGRLEDSAGRAAEGLTSALGDLAHTINREGSLFSLFFGPNPVTDYVSARAADHGAYAAFFHAMLDRGIYLPPSGYEGWFLSAAHD
ncbi:MAG: glutamate-1-semialdehyde 2,1-aminomutase, partial [Actinobacteria bacterium]|nr:glutamate-1-semialdehyde 2,1-aminomutase [Actinomycetota bacterium]